MARMESARAYTARLTAPVHYTTHWSRPRWMLAALLGGLGTIGPFAVDTYLPAFTGIAASLAASPVQMQQTLSAYLLGIAVMNLFHGALSDGFGRRPVILAGIGVFALASIGCALADNIGTLVAWRVLQGLSGGAGMVVARAIVRDLFDAVDAQRMMSQMTLFFGVAPALAPLIGGVLFVHLGWASIFWFLAGVGLLLWVSCAAWLPETLPPERRQSLRIGPLMRGYWALLGSARFVTLVMVERAAVQRLLSLRAEFAGVAGHAPAPRADAVLRVLRDVDLLRDGGCLGVRPPGRACAEAATDPPGLCRSWPPPRSATSH